jgi:tripartite-type tricarboxylate transporter receptor subunit TctC
MNYGSAGLGTGGHLAGELYKQMTGHPGAAHPVQGQRPVAHRPDRPAATTSPSPGCRRAGAGARRQAARHRVTTPKRLAAIPDVPAGRGERCPASRSIGWYGVIGPAGMPAPLVKRLHDELTRVLALPEVRSRIAADGAEPVGSAPSAFREFMAADLAKWAKLVKESGAKLE